MAELLFELYSEEIPPQLQIAARSQLKKFSNYNFVVKPFKLKQLVDIIKDFFIFR